MNNAITLTGGMRQNLYSMQNTQNLMELTQRRLASGKRVLSALDDPINYFSALGHEQRANDLASRKDEMSEAIQTVKAGDAGIEAITTLLAQAKSIAQSAKSAESTTTAASLAVDFNDVLDQMDYIAADSGYKGINLMDGSTETITVEFDQDGGSKLTLTGFGGSSGGLSVSDAASSWATASNIDTAITALDTARDTLRTESKTLSSQLNIITARQDFTSKMINTARWCGQADQRRHERGRRQHADAPDPSAPGHHFVELGLSGCPVRSETVLIRTLT